MSAIRSLLLSWTGLLLLGCLSPGHAEPLPIRNLAKGALSGIGEAKQEVIRDKAAWEKAWATHAGGTKTAATLPEVDFGKEMVIVVTFGRHTTGGYAIEITNVEPTNDKLRIVVARKTPPAGSMTIQVLTAPFHMVAVPKSDLKPQFEEGKAPEPKRH